LEAAGLPLEPQYHLDGVSIAPLLRGETIAHRALYWHYPHYGNQGGMPGSAIRDGRWKLIQWHEDRPLELYDLTADPSESRNLADRNVATATRLQESLAAWRGAVGSKVPTSNPRFDSAR
jgi:arylsulfatase A-like enzyme